MLSIGIGEIQKNSSIFSNLTEAMQIIDKRKRQVLAMVYPVQHVSTIDKLAGKYKNRVNAVESDIETIKKRAIQTAMEEKYGLSF